MNAAASLEERASTIALTLDDYRDNGYLTHHLHPYPAKFIPQIPAEIISKLTVPGAWVLDPYCGSGTTLVEAALLGRNCVGTDINPLSCKIAEAKASKFTAAQLGAIEGFLQEVAMPGALKKIKARPPNFDAIDKWFSPVAKREIASLLALIQLTADRQVRNFLEVVLSAILVKASNQESDTRYKAVEKDIRPDDVRSMFHAKLKDAISRARDFASRVSSARVGVWRLDATAETPPVDVEFDLVVTSPPYMNSYDYYLYHKHRMRWLGLDVADTQEREFGSRNKHNDRGLGLDAYNDAVTRSVRLVRERMSKNGLYCVIVGDAIWRGTLLKMNSNYDTIFEESGFRKVREIAFPQRKYTRSFTANLRTEHKDSYVLVYAKAP